MLWVVTSSRTHVALIATATVALALGTAACSTGGSPNTGALGTAPPDCSALATKFAGAVTGFPTSSNPDIALLFGELNTVLPNDLKDDAKVLAGTFDKFSAALQKNNGDAVKTLADPAGKAAVDAMGSEKNAAAVAAIEHYFAVLCPAQ